MANILVVDAEAQIRRMLSRILGRQGYTCTLCADAAPRRLPCGTFSHPLLRKLPVRAPYTAHAQPTVYTSPGTRVRILLCRPMAAIIPSRQHGDEPGASAARGMIPRGVSRFSLTTRAVWPAACISSLLNMHAKT